ncbi:MAG TPA: hypothetical protein VNH19_18905 [Candidatus Limnocylindrales bacterium]|nr:hypothetical protein [Candidatus Limnocylindrales bacterium]
MFTKIGITVVLALGCVAIPFLAPWIVAEIRSVWTEEVIDV